MLRLQLAIMMGLCVIFGANAVGEIKLSPWGTDAVRVQMSLEAGDPIAEPVRSALLPNPPVRHQHNTTFDGPSTVIHGNLRVSVDTSGLVTATRISDGVVLLEQVSLKLGDAVMKTTNLCLDYAVMSNTNIDPRQSSRQQGCHCNLQRTQGRRAFVRTRRARKRQSQPSRWWIQQNICRFFILWQESWWGCVHPVVHDQQWLVVFQPEWCGPNTVQAMGLFGTYHPLDQCRCPLQA